MARDIFDEIAEAKTTKRSDFVKPGRYIFDVKNLIYKTGEEGKFFVAELMVVESHAKDTTVPPNAVGSTVGHMACFYGKAARSAPGNTKNTIAAIFGEDPDSVDKGDFRKIIDELLSEDGQKKQLARGRRVAGETNRSEKEGNVRHFLNLTPVSDSFNTPEEVAKRRAIIEAGGGADAE